MTQSQTPPDDDDRKIAALDQSYFRDAALIRLQSISDFAQSVWKGLMLVNGGAIVALFTLLGNASMKVDAARIWYAFFAFALGIFATLASNLVAYITQSAYFQQDTSSAWNAQELMHGRPPKWQKALDREIKIGGFTEWTALVAAVVGLLAFLVGSMLALSAVVPAVSATPKVSTAALPSKHLGHR